jgi:hypothetical protein
VTHKDWDVLLGGAPGDLVLRLAYRDWLLENGHDLLAKGQAPLLQGVARVGYDRRPDITRGSRWDLFVWEVGGPLHEKLHDIAKAARRTPGQVFCRNLRIGNWIADDADRGYAVEHGLWDREFYRLTFGSRVKAEQTLGLAWSAVLYFSQKNPPGAGGLTG